MREQGKRRAHIKFYNENEQNISSASNATSPLIASEEQKLKLRWDWLSNCISCSCNQAGGMGKQFVFLSTQRESLKQLQNPTSQLLIPERQIITCVTLRPNERDQPTRVKPKRSLSLVSLGSLRQGFGQKIVLVPGGACMKLASKLGAQALKGMREPGLCWASHTATPRPTAATWSGSSMFRWYVIQLLSTTISRLKLRREDFFQSVLWETISRRDNQPPQTDISMSQLVLWGTHEFDNCSAIKFLIPVLDLVVPNTKCRIFYVRGTKTEDWRQWLERNFSPSWPMTACWSAIWCMF